MEACSRFVSNQSNAHYAPWLHPLYFTLNVYLTAPLHPSIVMNTQKHWPTPSLENIPRDVLTQIIIHTVSLSSSTPTPRELTTVYSLLLTCRNVEQQLSLRNNPHLYADIFRLMFDVEAVGRRMGPSAITASALASELRPRIEALRRLKAVLDAEGTGSEVMSRDLTRIFLMITEDDGKNRHQLFYFVDLSRISDLLIAHSSRIRSSSGDFRHSTCVTLLVAIMWISSRTNLANGMNSLLDHFISSVNMTPLY